MTRLVPLGVVLLTVLGSGTAAGLWCGRWGSTRTVAGAAARLSTIPFQLGADWDVEERQVSEREAAAAELEGWVARRYLHRRTGAIIHVLLLCGRPGPISVHTPEVCYSAAGYDPVGHAKEYKAPPGSPWRFQVRDFQKSTVASPLLLRVFFSWGTKGEWSVPTNPRLAFAANSFLYKLYVIRQTAKTTEPIEQDPSVELIKELLPQLQEKLFGDT
jgi:hypothetical protein